MPDAVETYAGACHCGAVAFEAACDFSMVSACNCSICDMKGLNLVFVPTDRFSLTSGEPELTEYRLNRKAIGHQFCRVCGVQPFARGTKPDGAEMVAVNVRRLKGVDAGALEKTPIDGRSF